MGFGAPIYIFNLLEAFWLYGFDLGVPRPPLAVWNTGLAKMHLGGVGGWVGPQGRWDHDLASLPVPPRWVTKFGHVLQAKETNY